MIWAAVDVRGGYFLLAVGAAFLVIYRLSNGAWKYDRAADRGSEFALRGLLAGAVCLVAGIALFVIAGVSSDEQNPAVTEFSCATRTGDDREMCDWFASAGDDTHFINVQGHFTAPVEIEIPAGVRDVIDGVCDPLDCVGFEAEVIDLRDAQIQVVLTIWTVDGPLADTVDTMLPFRTRMDNRYASALDNRFLRNAAQPGEPFLPVGFRIGVRLPGAPSRLTFPGDPADEQL